MFRGCEKFIVLVIRPLAGKNRYGIHLRGTFGTLTSSFNEISGKRRVTAIGSDNRKRIHGAELSILLRNLFYFAFYDCGEWIGRIKTKQARQI